VDTPEQSVQILKQGGRYAGIAQLKKELPQDLFRHKQITAQKFLFQSNNEQLNEIAELVASLCSRSIAISKERA
jgi:hypothetical protein